LFWNTATVRENIWKHHFDAVVLGTTLYGLQPRTNLIVNFFTILHNLSRIDRKPSFGIVALMLLF
jgi:hypothetical protein